MPTQFLKRIVVMFVLETPSETLFRKKNGTYLYREDPKRPEKTQKDPKRPEKTHLVIPRRPEKTHLFIPRRPGKTREDPKRSEKTRKDPKRHPKRPKQTRKDIFNVDVSELKMTRVMLLYNK